MANDKFSEDNIESIQQYVTGVMTEAEKKDFEEALKDDKDLQILVDQYRIMQEGFELNELERKRQRLKNIKQLSTEEVVFPKEEVVKSDITTPVVSLRRVLSYAAMLIPGLLLGWLFFGSPKNSNSGVQYVDNSETENPAGQKYGGDTEDYIMLYEGESLLIKVFQEAKENVLLSKVANQQIDLIVSEVDKPSEEYTLEDGLLEISLPKGTIKEDNLENATIRLILQKLQTPNLQLSLLEINQRTIQVPFSDEDFERLFN